jgi:glutathione synthase/RimK-type ligase-like ATP-grasp enzyme
MIVVFGSGADSCIQLVVDAAVALGVEHRLIDQEHLEHDELVLDVGGSRTSCVVQVAGERIDLADAGAIYARPLSIGSSERARAFSTGFTEYLDLVDCLVVSRPLSMRSNASKPFQSQLIASAGFDVPETLVTNDPCEVRRFANQHGRVVFKSTSGIRSIVREVDAARLADLERVRTLPTQFQAYVPGVDVRVHVVGESVFATEVTTKAIDYRYAARDGQTVDHRAVDLDPATSTRCIALAHLLELPLCGIDLRRTPDGTYVCFEVNPMPAFSYYEANSGQPISTALVSMLAAAA